MLNNIEMLCRGCGTYIGERNAGPIQNQKKKKKQRPKYSSCHAQHRPTFSRESLGPFTIGRVLLRKQAQAAIRLERISSL
uniref:Uncharacterized protein n=1 Tax=Oryza brachyantha TaxID=4533 RepID=J3M2U5_ORYBR